MRRKLFPPLAGILLMTLLSVSVRQAGAQGEVIGRGKHATVLVEVKAAQESGSAFCVSTKGFFVTNAHVVENAGRSRKVTLVLNPAEANQKVVTATILRYDKEADLALLGTENVAGLTALELGETRDLEETQSVVAFGYPFGKDLAEGKDDYPNVTVSTGKITALRKSGGKLQHIQVDASLNEGNSGGPMLNARGQVIGVVEEGIPGAGINYAIPVDQVKAFLSRPEVVFQPKPISYAQRAEPTAFDIQLVSFLNRPDAASVTLALSVGGAGPRSFTGMPVELQGNTARYVVRAVPAPAENTPALSQWRSIDYKLTVKQNGVAEEITGTIPVEGAPVPVRKAPKGVLIVAADESTTNDSSFEETPRDSTTHFVQNIAYYFTGGKKGKFLIYSNNPCFGTRFQHTLQAAGHSVTQSLTPDSLNAYDGVFVCGNAEVSVQLLSNYIARGGRVYLAGGTGGNEPKIFNDFLKPFGVAYEPWPNDYSTVQATAFSASPLFESVKALIIHGINPIRLLPGDWPHRSIACNQYGHIYWVVSTADTVVTDGTNKAPQLAPADGYLVNPANGHAYGAVFLDHTVSWKEAKAAAEGMTYKGRRGHLVTITSTSESEFVLRNFERAVNGNPWLGAYKDTQASDYKNPASGWHWITGEPWQYTNWSGGEPNGASGGPNSDFLQFWNHGRWNDQGNTPPNAVDAVRVIIVEFEP